MREFSIATGTSVIAANSYESAAIATGLFDAARRPVINVGHYGEEANYNVYITDIEYSGGQWQFKVRRSIGAGQDEITNFFWKVISVNPKFPDAGTPVVPITEA